MISVKDSVSAIIQNLAKCATPTYPEEQLKSLLAKLVFQGPGETQFTTEC